MTKTTRDELFACFAELASRYPHWRAGQLVANVAEWTGAGVWEADDAEVLAAARQHLATLDACTAAKAEFSAVASVLSREAGGAVG